MAVQHFARKRIIPSLACVALALSFAEFALADPPPGGSSAGTWDTDLTGQWHYVVQINCNGGTVPVWYENGDALGYYRCEHPHG